MNTDTSTGVTAISARASADRAGIARGDRATTPDHEPDRRRAGRVRQAPGTRARHAAARAGTSAPGARRSAAEAAARREAEGAPGRPRGTAPKQPERRRRSAAAETARPAGGPPQPSAGGSEDIAWAGVAAAAEAATASGSGSRSRAIEAVAAANARARSDPVAVDRPAAGLATARLVICASSGERAYEENITGLSAMVAYNLMLAIFPFALLLLFVAGQVFSSSPHIEPQRPDRSPAHLPQGHRADPLAASGLDRVRESSTSIGVLALLAGVWIGTSFWGAMDTAFCRIYHVPCRSWVAQKSFALVMLAGGHRSSSPPPSRSRWPRACSSRARRPTVRLDEIAGLRSAVALRGLAVTFVIVSSDLLRRPQGPRARPCVLFVTLTTAIANGYLPGLPRPNSSVQIPDRRPPGLHPRRPRLVLHSSALCCWPFSQVAVRVGRDREASRRSAARAFADLDARDSGSAPPGTKARRAVAWLGRAGGAVLSRLRADLIRSRRSFRDERTRPQRRVIVLHRIRG